MRVANHQTPARQPGSSIFTIPKTLTLKVRSTSTNGRNASMKPSGTTPARCLVSQPLHLRAPKTLKKTPMTLYQLRLPHPLAAPALSTRKFPLQPTTMRTMDAAEKPVTMTKEMTRRVRALVDRTTRMKITLIIATTQRRCGNSKFFVPCTSTSMRKTDASAFASPRSPPLRLTCKRLPSRSQSRWLRGAKMRAPTRSQPIASRLQCDVFPSTRHPDSVRILRRISSRTR
mmetsp:Transcript_5915/g.6403  ORF Transcript_5915/g.6403 Transcript_5915/m.6403 type:complete len:230 (-) Transcript_5915:1955-2644(-)